MNAKPKSGTEQPEQHYLERELRDLFAADPSILDFIESGACDGMWFWDLENPEHEWMSGAFWRTIGHDPESRAHLASEWRNLIHPDDLKVATANFRAHLADPECPYDQIARYKHPDGSWVAVRCRGRAIRDENGVPIRMLGVHTDMEAFAKAQRSASENARLLKNFLATSRAGMIGMDKSGAIITASESAWDMLGIPHNSTGEPWPEDLIFLDPETMEPVLDADNPILKARAGKAVDPMTFRLRRKNSRDLQYARVAATVMDDPDSRLRVIISLDDVTTEIETRVLADRANRLDVLGQLTGDIAHDFNNILGAILPSLELAMMRSQHDPEMQTSLQPALNATRRGGDLSQRLLAFASRQLMSARSIGIAEALEEASSFAARLLDASISLKVAPVPKEVCVVCDPSQLQNALLNLILNARDAIGSSGKGSTITLASRVIKMRARGAEVVEISVSDDGPGMSADVRERAVDPFFTTKPSKNGSGLGLSIVYGFVKQSDGEMRIYSEEGRGSTIRLILPSGHGEASVEAERPHVIDASDDYQVLVVEDESDLRATIANILTALGYRHRLAGNADEAAALIDTHGAFDLLITDIIMPGDMNGFDLVRLVHKTYPDMPVIFMSGYASFAEEKAGELGAPMLQKPCDMVELSRIVADALKGRKKRTVAGALDGVAPAT